MREPTECIEDEEKKKWIVCIPIKDVRKAE